MSRFGECLQRSYSFLTRTACLSTTEDIAWRRLPPKGSGEPHCLQQKSLSTLASTLPYSLLLTKYYAVIIGQKCNTGEGESRVIIIIITIIMESSPFCLSVSVSLICTHRGYACTQVIYENTCWKYLLKHVCPTGYWLMVPPFHPIKEKRQ